MFKRVNKAVIHDKDYNMGIWGLRCLFMGNVYIHIKEITPQQILEHGNKEIVVSFYMGSV